MADTRMSQAEREAFLADLHVGVLAIPSDGAPLTAPIWYDYEPGGEIWVLTGPTSRKGRLLAEGTRVTLVAQQEALPYAYVSVEGTVRKYGRQTPVRRNTWPSAISAKRWVNSMRRPTPTPPRCRSPFVRTDG